MKNKKVLLAILAIALVLGMAACKDKDDGGDSTSWPDAATLDKYYLSGFTKCPDGLTFVKWLIEDDGQLRMYFTPYETTILGNALKDIGWFQASNYVTFTKNKPDGSEVVLWIHSASDIDGMYLGVR